MDKSIEIRARYSVHKLSQLAPVKGGESKTYKLILGDPEDNIIRTGYTEEGKIFIDPSGGPFITIGTKIKDFIVKSIDYSYDLGGYVITFE